MSTVDPNNPETLEFIKLLSANQGRIYAYILSMVTCYSDADDIMQETCVTMWQKFGEFQAGTDFLAWGTTIAFYRTLEFRKRTKRSGMPQFEEHIFKMIQTKAAQQANEDNLYIDKLRDCIKKMKKDDQYLIDLRYWQNIDVKNISVRLGHSARSVYYNLARVQRLLIHCINRNTSAEAR